MSERVDKVLDLQFTPFERVLRFPDYPKVLSKQSQTPLCLPAESFNECFGTVWTKKLCSMETENPCCHAVCFSDNSFVVNVVEIVIQRFEVLLVPGQH